jgi:hypothetical protein
MITETDKTRSVMNIARLAGFLYLLMVVGGMITEVLLPGFIVAGDGAATAAKIVASEGLYRLNFVLDMIWMACYLLSAWALYVLLRPVGKSTALLFVLLTTASVAILCLNALSEFAAMLLFLGSGSLTAFTASQQQALGMFFLDLHATGFMIAQVFFGLWLLPLGYLVYKSGFLPRALGILLMLGCFGCLVEFFQFFLFPGWEVITYPGMAISAVAEISFCLWLLIMGAKDRAAARGNDLRVAGVS